MTNEEWMKSQFQRAEERQRAWDEERKQEQKQTRKRIAVGVATGLAVVLAIILLCMCLTRVPAGYVAVQYSINGGVKDKVLTQGWHLVAPTTKTTKYTVGIEQSYLSSEGKGDSDKNESFEASSSEGKAVTIDLTFTYQYLPDDVRNVFVKFKGQSGEEVRDVFIKPNIVSWSKEVLANYKVSDMLGAERANINLELTEYLAKKFKPYGITISNVSLINIDVDEATMKAINNKITAQQNAESQAIKNKIAIEKAEAEAKVKLTKAEAEAKANKIVSESLSDKVLREQYIEKWNGELPQTVAGDTSVNMLIPSAN